MDLSQAQWTEQLSKDDNAIILDVRTEVEVSEGHIPNMKHLDIYNASGFMAEAQQMDPTKNYYVYCRSGGRSSQACAILKSLGFENTFNLLGGFTEWEGETTL
jgi:rhodanese-related sulfurtransferase